MTRPILALLLFALTGCSAPMSEAPDSADFQKLELNANQTLCEEPRGQVCTREYRPVCGTNNEDKTKTYSNACAACANSLVLMHQEGECQ